MPHPANITIDSGVVEAPPASISGHQSSPTTPAPSQATQDSTATTDGNGTHSHQLNSHAYENGIASQSHPAGRVPFQPVGRSPNEEGNVHVTNPPLPPRGDGAPITDGVSNPGAGELGGHPHGPPHVRRGDYAPGAASNPRETLAGGHLDTTASTGAGISSGTGADATYPETSTRVGSRVGAGTDNRTTSAKIKEGASGVKGLAAAVHGAGETLRGTFNREVDRAFGDKAGELKNERIARDGEAEIQEGRFVESTKNREGIVPGSNGGRRV